MTTRTLELGNGLQISVDERGDANESGGSGVLLLHGGAGARSMAGLAAALSEHAYVITATHPGFDGTPRVPWLDAVGDLADAYLANSAGATDPAEKQGRHLATLALATFKEHVAITSRIANEMKA